MDTAAADPTRSVQSGFAALRAGDPQAARAHFRRAVDAGVRNPDVQLGLSAACRLLGQDQEELQALDEALALEPRHLPSLICKGDFYARTQDLRAADSFYAAALKLAAAAAPPPELRPQLDRIAAARREFAAVFETNLRSALDAAGMAEPGAERFAHAFDLLLGKRQLYLQQPRYFYFPELAQTQFTPRTQFAWAEALEAATDDIREELRGVLAGRTGIEPYIKRSADRPWFGHSLEDNLDWSACYLIRNGEEVAENAERCPRTMAAVRKLPLCRIDGRTPSVLFSLLKPGAHILPHHGFMNARLICHLPLIVPPNCALRVGSETREWREGELLMFDDSVEHEAWNRSDALRAVLIFDVWKPELTEKERDLIAALLSSVDAFGAAGAKWVE